MNFHTARFLLRWSIPVALVAFAGLLADYMANESRLELFILAGQAVLFLFVLVVLAAGPTRQARLLDDDDADVTLYGANDETD